MDIPLTATYVRDGEWIVAWIEELPGVATQGKTIEEARANLQDALQETIEARREIARRKALGQTVVSREPFTASV
jgi:predicted RNase H-like HicB family nuclease